MGSCIPTANKTDNQKPSVQLKIRRIEACNPQSASKQSSEKTSPKSIRLSQVKAKLPPLKKGAEQRKRIMSMCSNQRQTNTGNYRNAKSLKQLQSQQNKILEISVKNQLQSCRNQIFRSTMATFQSSDNYTNEQFRSQTTELKCTKCQSQMDSHNYQRKQIKDKQHNMCKDCATQFSNFIENADALEIKLKQKTSL